MSHMCAGVCEGQEKMSELLELDLQEVVKLLMWVLQTERASSSRTESVCQLLSHLSSSVCHVLKAKTQNKKYTSHQSVHWAVGKADLRGSNE